MVVEARKLLGIHEAAGSVNEPTIMKWADEVGGDVKEVY